jgi:hypothetical protein
MGRTLVAVALGAALALSACGGGSHTPAHTTRTTPPAAAVPAAPAAEVAVVRAWADLLRNGHVARADSLFSVPVIVSNGTPPLPLTTRAQIHGFDVSLPCGARLLRAVEHHGYVLAEFKLTERLGPGGGHCDGPGASASAAFRIVHGKIREWRRIVGLPGTPAPPPPATTSPQV